ncbi:fungal hydrophobin [Mycena rebaudengoi]|nr:fungal hydrophobin [Mycena rebaudengoi]
MFSKLSVIVTSVLITLAAATPMGRTNTPPVTTPRLSPVLQQRRSLQQHCRLRRSRSPRPRSHGLDVLVGLSCSLITVVGNNCDSTTVNCSAPKEQWGGLIAINCIPITL